MPPRLKIDSRTKRIAKKGLERAKKYGVGLTTKEARKLGINSGRARARQLINSDSISLQDAKEICRFKRFFGLKQTRNVKIAIEIWGGKSFIKRCCKFVKKNA